MAPSNGKMPCADVLLVAHGHILRAFAMRWVRKPLHDNLSFILEAGGVGTLRSVVARMHAGRSSICSSNDIFSYQHHRVEEPAILLGGSFVVDVVEKTANEVREATK
jgi:probable phosphoglycerate mutase